MPAGLVSVAAAAAGSAATMAWQDGRFSCGRTGTLASGLGRHCRRPRIRWLRSGFGLTRVGPTAPCSAAALSAAHRSCKNVSPPEHVDGVARWSRQPGHSMARSQWRLAKPVLLPRGVSFGPVKQFRAKPKPRQAPIVWPIHGQILPAFSAGCARPAQADRRKVRDFSVTSRLARFVLTDRSIQTRPTRRCPCSAQQHRDQRSRRAIHRIRQYQRKTSPTARPSASSALTASFVNYLMRPKHADGERARLGVATPDYVNNVFRAPLRVPTMPWAWPSPARASSRCRRPPAT